MSRLLSEPWPWYVAGPLIGLLVPFVFWFGGRKWGISSSLDHLCSAALPTKPASLRYDWWGTGAWTLAMVAGVGAGGWVAATFMRGTERDVDLAPATLSDLAALGLSNAGGFLPREVFSWSGLLAPSGFVMIVLGGFLVGFGARYAGGCTSGHAISGLATLRLSSLFAVMGFFVGGLIAAHLLLPRLL